MFRGGCPGAEQNRWSSSSKGLVDHELSIGISMFGLVVKWRT
jgi:hypothetical protein